MIALIELAAKISISLLIATLIGFASLIVFLWFESDIIEKIKTIAFILILSHFLPCALQWCNKKGISAKIENILLFYKFLLF
jgi:hypothetical protein